MGMTVVSSSAQVLGHFYGDETIYTVSRLPRWGVMISLGQNGCRPLLLAGVQQRESD